MRKFTRILSVMTVLVLLCAAALPAFAEYELVVPEEYKETGTIPIYRAVKNDFASIMQPEWLNQSGIAEKRGEGAYTFNDHADLFYYPESISYMKYTGEMVEINWAEREENPEIEPEWGQQIALPHAIERLANAAYAGMREYAKGVTLEHEQLTLISLAEARQEAETFIARVGMEDQGYELACALDMDLERIRTIGEGYNRFWYDEGRRNSDMLDYTTATVEDEGYFLLYTPLGAPRISYMDSSYLTLYVTSRGIEDAHFGAEYRREEIVDTPASLISPDEAAARFYEELASADSRLTVDSLDQIALVYLPSRAKNKKDGMVFIPVWQISYTSHGRNRHWAYFNAMDGKLINSMFK